MLIGPLPTASNRATWIENFEFHDMTDDSLVDFSTAEEITFTIRDPSSGAEFIRLRKSSGEVTTPTIGVVSIRADVGTMNRLEPKTYEVAMEVLEEGDTVQMLLGTLPVLGW
jgi:hypothetical protein